MLPKEWVSATFDLARQATQCQRLVQALERSRFPEAHELSEDARRQEVARVDFQNNLSRKLRIIKESSKRVNKVVERLTSLGKGVASVTDLQKSMEQLQGEMAEFKATMSAEFERSVTEESALSRELSLLTERFNEAWESNDPSSGDELDSRPVNRWAAKRDAKRPFLAGRRGDTKKEDHGVTLKAQIYELERQIERDGGTNGRWSPQEQNTFLGLWTQAFPKFGKAPIQDTAAFRRNKAQILQKSVRGFLVYCFREY